MSDSSWTPNRNGTAPTKPLSSSADVSRPGANDDVTKNEQHPDNLYDDAVEVKSADPGRGRSVAMPGVTSPSGSITEEVIPPGQTPYQSPPVEHRGDPLAPAPSTHPVGTGVGAATAAAAGMVAGTAIGAIAGPIGSAVGAVVGGAIGGFVGGFAGKEVAEALNPSDEDSYWKGAYANRPYVKKGQTFDHYQRAYARGVELRRLYPDRQWDDVCPEAQAQWKADSEYLPWNDAEKAMQDAWDRLTPRHPDL